MVPLHSAASAVTLAAYGAYVSPPLAIHSLWLEFIYDNKLDFQYVGSTPPLFHPKFQGVPFALDR